MRRQLLLILTTAALAAVAGCRRSADPGALAPLNGGRMFTDAAHHFALSFPPEWETKAFPRAIAVISHPLAQPGQKDVTLGMVTVKPVTPGATLEQRLATYKADLLKSAPDCAVTEEHRVTVSGSAAVWFVWSTRNPNFQAQAVTLLVDGKGFSYDVACTTTPEQFSQLRPTLEGICGSFRLQ